MSRFKRRVFIVLLSYFLFPTLAQAVKPRPPVQLMFQDAVLSETEMEITLTARSNIETNSLVLSLTLPSDLSLLEGELEWEGSLSAGAEQMIRVIILKPVQASVIEGKAVIRLPNDAIFEQENRLILKESGAKSSKPGTPMKQERNHGSILEFR
ncbi:hypothetical protein MNBD_NITROSPIRAE01-2343 [hydrothermal vent metagenome]|uniref:Uncharacterized protein n=1 Tax=hydrothermal vent metagenome TaxID=652676 RepID=A0A3B1CZS1_9ZZZZ